jgi:hypothetical protein
MWVRGKTKSRELIARHSCLNYLKRIHQRCPDIAHMTLDELLRSEANLHVFRLPDGTVTKNLNQTFRGGLLKDPRTEQNRTFIVCGTCMRRFKSFMAAPISICSHGKWAPQSQ